MSTPTLVSRIGPLILTVLVGVPASYGSRPVEDPAPAQRDTEDDCEETAPEGVIATLDGEPIARDRIEALAAPALAKIEQQRLEARFGLLSRVVQDHLLAREASRREVSVEELLDAEVARKVAEPTEIEIVQYGRRFPERYGSDPEAAREWILADLRAERVIARGEQFLNSLTEGVTVEWPFDFRAGDAAPGRTTVVAVVDGVALSAESIVELWEDQEHEADLAAYHERKFHLDRLINSRLLEAAAREAGTDSRTLLSEWIDARFVAITDAEVDEFHRANRARIAEPLEAIRPQIRDHLAQQRRFDLELAFASALRDGVDLTIHLREPQPPVHIIEVEGRPMLGPEDAPITVVAFTDLQCGRCRELHSWLVGLPEYYGGSVRVVLRHKPLLTLHPRAHDLALAAEAARGQDAFFPFVEKAFEEQGVWADASTSDEADPDPILAWAASLGLDLARFEAARGSGAARRIVEDDIAEAERLGIRRTPVIFVNGRRVEDSSVESLVRAVRAEHVRLGLEVEHPEQ